MKADPVEFVFGLLFLGMVALVGLIASAIRGPARYNVITKGGASYCPRCNRQVSMRREHCRSCGYAFVSYGPTAADKVRDAQELARVREEVRLSVEELSRYYEKQRQDRQRKRELRRQERLLRQAGRAWFYQDRGIKPGTFAWFFLLPDWLQAILFGLAIAAPAILIIVLLFRSGR